MEEPASERMNRLSIRGFAGIGENVWLWETAEDPSAEVCVVLATGSMLTKISALLPFGAG